MDYSLPFLWNNLVDVFTAGLNNWGDLHPAIVHIPIALLLIAPLFILLGLFFKRSSKMFYLNALILLVIGTLFLYLATMTGEEASEFVESNPSIVTTLDAHDKLAHRVRLNFSILTSIFLTYILLNSFLTRKFSPRIHRSFLIVLLIACAYNILILLNTAYQGGKLVHHHGITSKLYTDKDTTK